MPHVSPVHWVGSSRRDLRGFPDEVQDEVGFALWFAQIGDKHPDSKPLRGFGGAGVLEVISNYDGDTFRMVYTVRLSGRIYVLHAFQKKSKTGIRTPDREMDLVRARLAAAEAAHQEWLQAQAKTKE